MTVKEFCDWLDKHNLHLCGVDLDTEMEEKYCPYFKKEYKGHTGGFCKAKCDEDCKVEYIEEIDQHIHTPWVSKWYCKKHECLKIKHPIRLDIYCPKCKPHLELVL